jgi:uncharacterized protein (TIGR02996 family)
MNSNVNEPEPLLNTIRSEPNDDEAVLVLADWLDDNYRAAEANRIHDLPGRETV